MMAISTAQEDHFQGRHDEEQHDRADEHAAYDDGGQRALDLAANAGRNRGWKQADAGGQTGHEERAHTSRSGAEHRVQWGAAAKQRLFVVGHQENAVHD